MSRLGTTFATLLERTRRVVGVNDAGEIEYTQSQLNGAHALGIVLSHEIEPVRSGREPAPELSAFVEEDGPPMNERVAFDPLDIEGVIARHRMTQSHAEGYPVFEGCACSWLGDNHTEHLAGLITALAQPVPEVIRQTLTAVEIRLFGAYLIDPVTGVDSAKQRQKIWETT